jgi:hypothetical protein
MILILSCFIVIVGGACLSFKFISLEARSPGHAQTPPQITDAKIGKVFHVGDMARLLDGMKSTILGLDGTALDINMGYGSGEFQMSAKAQ